MALFGIGKKNIEAKKETKQEEKPQKISVKSVATPTEGFSSVLLGTRVTEKVSLLAEKHNTYTFNISSDATKGTVFEAIEKLYKVQPVKVRIVTIPSKRVFVRGKRGVKSGGRKAYVSLKQGDKIENS